VDLQNILEQKDTILAESRGALCGAGSSTPKTEMDAQGLPSVPYDETETLSSSRSEPVYVKRENTSAYHEANKGAETDLGCASGLGEDLPLFVNSLLPVRLRFSTDGIPLSGSFQSCHPIRTLWALGGSSFASIAHPRSRLFDIEVNRILKTPAPRTNFL
jgi:hypothetical protein